MTRWGVRWSSTVLLATKRSRTPKMSQIAKDVVVNTYAIRNAKVLERDPCPLHKRTEAASEKGDTCIPRMCVGGVEGLAGTLKMIFFSRVRGR